LCFFPLVLIPGVSIHQSIKSRVETSSLSPYSFQKVWSLSINPSNQGLKLRKSTLAVKGFYRSLSINPSNQGLKPTKTSSGLNNSLVSIHQSIKSRVETNNSVPNFSLCFLSLSINPSNQGLKLTASGGGHCQGLSLSINPSNQGLKLQPPFSNMVVFCVSIHQSIKSRVETKVAGHRYSIL